MIDHRRFLDRLFIHFFSSLFISLFVCVIFCLFSYLFVCLAVWLSLCRFVGFYKVVGLFVHPLPIDLSCGTVVCAFETFEGLQLSALCRFELGQNPSAAKHSGLTGGKRCLCRAETRHDTATSLSSSSTASATSSGLQLFSGKGHLRFPGRAITAFFFFSLNLTGALIKAFRRRTQIRRIG